MLASLLPGLRDVRAPLACGCLWLVVAWLVFEPIVPEASDAEGVVKSAYRAGDALSVVGLGFVISFAAYVVGVLSASLLTPLLRRAFPRTRLGQSDSAYRNAIVTRSALSPQALKALDKVVHDAHTRLTNSLVYTGQGLLAFLDATASAVFVGPISRPPKGEQESPSDGDADLIFHRPEREMIGPGYAEPDDPDARAVGRLTVAVLDDLGGVTTTRLLGRDPELYAAVDRNRAEAEFRLAIIPPLVALALALGAGVDRWLWPVLLVLTALVVWGLFSAAVSAAKSANEVLLQSIADGRVQCPTLDRWFKQAAEAASRTDPELRRIAGTDALVALDHAVISLEYVPASEPSLATYARRQVDLTAQPLERVAAVYSPDVVDAINEAKQWLEEVADGWVAAIEGKGPPAHEPRELLERAKERIEAFRKQVPKVPGDAEGS